MTRQGWLRVASVASAVGFFALGMIAGRIQKQGEIEQLLPTADVRVVRLAADGGGGGVEVARRRLFPGWSITVGAAPAQYRLDIVATGRGRYVTSEPAPFKTTVEPSQPTTGDH